FLKSIFKSENIEKWVFRSILFSNIIILIVSLFQFSELPSLSVYDAYGINGIQGHKNLLASFVFLCLPFILLGFLSHQHNVWKTLFLLVLFLETCMFFILKTRAVYVGLSVSILCFFVISLKWYRNHLKSFPFLKISAFLILSFLFIAMLNFMKSDITPGIKSEVELRKGSNNERIQLLLKTKDLIESNSLKGVGAGNWQIEFASNGIGGIENAETQNTTFQRPHNDFLWIWAETGIIGLILILTFYTIIAVSVIRYFLQKSETSKDIKILILFSAFIGFLSVSFFDFPKERIEHYLLFMALIALLLKTADIKFENLLTDKYFIVRTVIIILLIFNTLIGYYRTIGETYTKKMYVNRVQNHWPLLIKNCDKAKSIFYTLDPTSIPLDWYRGVANFTLSNNNEALKDFASAYKLNPFNFHILNNLASAYETSGNHELAKRYYFEALRMNPEFDEARLNLFVIFYNEKSFKNCWDILKSCKQNSKRKLLYLQLLNKSNYVKN
ncbi:MAG: O-antigen ligase family protein, partial [Opitutaceae bacterium]|nr:O-antigen ligase family protein [Cytophagales bacterium]